MGISVLHINIQNWFKHRYILQTSLPIYNPDVILLNEISINSSSSLFLQGYNSFVKCNGQYSGVAILIKKGYDYNIINLNNINFCAIKLNTSYGPIIISTAYSPPREKIIPTPRP